MTKLTPEQIELLRKPLPEEAISQHPTKKFLSTIKAIYVVERLNEVFGIGEWYVSYEEIMSPNPTDPKLNKQVVVKGTLNIPDMAPIEQYGGNDNKDLGDAYKGAATDALTKIASYLEIGMDVYKGLSTPKGDETEINYDEPPVFEKPTKKPSFRI